MLFRAVAAGPRFESFLPIQLYVFSDGLFVVEAAADYRHLIGSRVVRIGRRTADEAAEILDPLISRDNRMTVRSKLPSFLIVPRLLKGVGIVGTGDEVEFLLEDSDGLYISDRLQESLRVVPMHPLESQLATSLEGRDESANKRRNHAGMVPADIQCIEKLSRNSCRSQDGFMHQGAGFGPRGTGLDCVCCDTCYQLLRWYGHLITAKYDGSKSRSPGPSVPMMMRHLAW